MAKTYLCDTLGEIRYEDLGDWHLDSDYIKQYNPQTGISLFQYQEEAIKNLLKVLSLYFEDQSANVFGKKKLFDRCQLEGLDTNCLDVPEFIKNKENDKFERLKNFYPVTHLRGGSGKVIEAYHFFNRAGFWMATASGKTLVLIKTIEILDVLQARGLTPQCNIMVLLPTEKIQEQFTVAVDDYNIGKSRKIHLTTLKDYDDEQNSFMSRLTNVITVFVYRSDLLSDEEKTKRVDTITYDNEGKWYILMDEAHKGDSADSIRKDKISIMSRNGFLFNFSATFADDIDYATTCFNFNLEKFIEAGYGKNVYLSESRYQFVRKTDDLSQTAKQLQVLKSLITLAMVKAAHKSGFYHSPLMVTLVNEVNTQDSDTDMFFEEIAKIAKGKVESSTISQAKKELLNEFRENKKFQFGSESLIIEDAVLEQLLNDITLETILLNVYNSTAPGNIEVIEGEKGKEFALKLATSSQFFALFRIGDATNYIKSKLAGSYKIVTAYEEKHYFDTLNSAEGTTFNMLIGSRMFYEGWDSNRPNVINFINIGKGDGKKFVLQSLGRGVRIEPTKNNRQRLKQNDSNKEQLLETLFIFATNRKVIETVLETMSSQRLDEKTLELAASDTPFDYLIPVYATKESKINASKFCLADSPLQDLQKYVSAFRDELLQLSTNIPNDVLRTLREGLAKPLSLFKIDNSLNYIDIPMLLEKVIAHLSIQEKYVSDIKTLEDEISHFKKIKLVASQWTQEDEKELIHFIHSHILTVDEMKDKIKVLTQRLHSNEINLDKFQAEVKLLSSMDSKKEIKDLQLYKISSHYYLPLILTKHNKVDYIRHVINVESEIGFVKNLIDAITENKLKSSYCWMFSKIDQTLDDHKISMPYYNGKDNKYHNFYPDFIFWLNKKTEYKIVFVDPKGMEYASYLPKIDGFKKLFWENGKAKIFSFGKYQVSFELKLVYSNLGTLPKEYETFWTSNDDFSWLE